jgi:hypothetical protein
MLPNIHHIQSNGKTYSFHVEQDLTVPCPACGCAACGREGYLWYMDEEKKITLVYDAAELEHFMSRFLEQNQLNYADLPDFIRAWNEDRDWVVFSNYEGAELNPADFKRAILLLELVIESPEDKQLWEALLAYAEKAQPLWILHS